MGVIRVSHHNQADNIKAKVAAMKEAVRRSGRKLRFIKTHIGPAIGQGTDFIPVLKELADYARRHGAVLLAESESRFVRSRQFHSINNPDAKPSDAEFAELAAVTGGATLAILDPPDAEASARIRRGMCTRAKRGGRPCSPGEMKARRNREMPIALEMLATCSLREVAIELDRPKASIQNWARQAVLNLGSFTLRPSSPNPFNRRGKRISTPQ